MLEVDRLIDYNLGAFIYDICRTELIDNDGAVTAMYTSHHTGSKSSQTWPLKLTPLPVNSCSTLLPLPRAVVAAGEV